MLCPAPSTVSARRRSLRPWPKGPASGWLAEEVDVGVRQSQPRVGVDDRANTLRQTAGFAEPGQAVLTAARALQQEIDMRGVQHQAEGVLRRLSAHRLCGLPPDLGSRNRPLLLRK